MRDVMASRVLGVVLAVAGVALQAVVVESEPIIVTPPYLFGEEPPTPTVLAESYGYPTEDHEVDSQGYRLTLFRIRGPRQEAEGDNKGAAGGPRGPRGPLEPIILQHGMASNAAQWVMYGPGKSLAYALADAGFDVWLASGRGSKYGREHRELNPDMADFWDFSWHEQGAEDLPNVIDFVLNATGYAQAWYAGHSMGTTMMFVMNAVRPEHGGKVKHHFALAPTAFLGRVKNPVVVDFKKKLEDTVQLWESLGMTHFSSNTPLLSTPRAALCAIVKSMCKQTFFFDTFGSDPKQSFENQAEIAGAYVPGDFSARQAIHYAQNAKSDETFKQFDHGADNEEIFNSTSPPDYDMSNVAVPTTFIYAENDQLSVPEDVVAFSKRFGRTPPIMHLVPVKEFDHGDFIMAREQNKYVHEPIIAFMKGIRHKTGLIPRRLKSAQQVWQAASNDKNNLWPLFSRPKQTSPMREPNAVTPDKDHPFNVRK